MKKKASTKSLHLGKETLRRLTNRELTSVGGGIRIGYLGSLEPGCIPGDTGPLPGGF